MLEDRHYMRRAAFPSGRSATVMLIIANVAAFILQAVHYGFPIQGVPVGDYFALSVDGLRHHYFWQLLTFQFMHGGVIHLLLNCWAIFMFGREVEETLGRKSFLVLYFSSGVVGGLFQVAFGELMARFLQDGRFLGPTVGASAGAFGL